MGDPRVKVDFGVVRNLALPVLFGTSYMDRFAMDVLSLERMKILYDSKPVPIPTINIMPEERKDEEKDKAQTISVIERDALRLARVASRTKNSSRSDGTRLDAADARGLGQIVPLQE